MLEFALVGATFFIMMLASIDLGRYYMFLHSARHAISEAGRAAMLAPACTANSTVGNPARDAVRAGFLGPSFNLTASCSADTTIWTWTITARRPFQWVIPVFGANETLIDDTAVFTFRKV